MCAILDANVAGQVFGRERPPAGEAFFRWINLSRGRLIAGGKLLRELDNNHTFTAWRLQAARAGRMLLLSDEAVDARAAQLEAEKACRSNDAHVVAVGQLGGARLLYSNDGDLQKGFRDKALIDQPRGKVYSTRTRDDMTLAHRRLLVNRNLCTRRGR